ncbi:MAG TPA: VOC family protein [Povalibacter sp.]|nr:VOC family protein [Povalibacter sp.]
MFDHIGLHVWDMEASRRFYTQVLAPLGYQPDASGTGFGPGDAPALWLYTNGKERHPSGVHVAFKASTRDAVERFHRAGLAAGGKDNGAPGVRADYAPNYFAAFLLDPDGNNVEAVCMT